MGWGLIGASTIARDHMVDAIRRIGGSPLMVMDDEPGKGAAFARDLDLPGSCDDLETILSDERIGAVFIGSSGVRHRDHVVAAAAAGKHVLCDGPLAATAADALTVVQACESCGVVLAVNHHLRSSPVHQAMQRMIAAGEIGAVRSLLILNAGLTRLSFQPGQGKKTGEGTLLLDMSIHDIDLACFLLQQKPETVVAIGGGPAHGASSTLDHAMFAMGMSAGTFVQVHESVATPHVESQVIALGSEGALLAAGTLTQRATGTLTRRLGGRNELLPLRVNSLYADTVDQFLRAVHGRGVPRATGQDGLQALAGVEAVALAMASGKSVTIRVPK